MADGYLPTGSSLMIFWTFALTSAMAAGERGAALKVEKRDLKTLNMRRGVKVMEKGELERNGRQDQPIYAEMRMEGPAAARRQKQVDLSVLVW